MKNLNIPIILFTIFAFGLPIWAMNNNDFPQTSVHDCKGDCYSNWQEETGGVVQVLADQQAARAAASPAELGKEKYIGCVACHGAGGEGGRAGVRAVSSGVRHRLPAGERSRKNSN